MADLASKFADLAEKTNLIRSQFSQTLVPQQAASIPRTSRFSRKSCSFNSNKVSVSERLLSYQAAGILARTEEPERERPRAAPRNGNPISYHNSWPFYQLPRSRLPEARVGIYGGKILL